MWCSSLMFVVFSCFPGMSCFGPCLLCFHVSRNVMFCFLFVLFSCLPGMSFSVCCFFMFPGMSCSASCCFHVAQECHVLVHVCCVFMFPRMSCSGSCLMCFHVTQECGVLIHVCCVFMFPGMWCSGSCLLCFHVSRNVVFWFMFVVFSCSQECHVLVHVCCVFVFPRNVVFWFMYEEKLHCCVCRISYHRAESRNPKPGEEVDPEQVNSCLLKHQGHSLEFSAGWCSHTLENPDALHPVCSSGDGQPLCSSVNMAWHLLCGSVMPWHDTYYAAVSCHMAWHQALFQALDMKTT